ncbi:TPA: hypothetical protein ACPTNX_000856 [Escherichia coli]|nr:hypothetical protein [Escherichia coli]
MIIKTLKMSARKQN